MTKALQILTLFLVLSSCKNVVDVESTNTAKSPEWSEYELEVIDKRVEALFPKENKVEKLGEGFTWTEGPVWSERLQMLLFSDVPNDVAYKWTKQKGIETFVSPSGYTDGGEYSSEQGSNGLLIGQDGSLYLCQHGNRALAKMIAPLEAPKAEYEFLVTEYNGKRFNSPNDLCQAADGAIYFTDPPYGLKDQAESTQKELPYQGVYRWHPEQGISLLLDSLTRPNGIALAPGDRALYVANSDPDKAYYLKYNLDQQGLIYEGGIMHNATSAAKEQPGLPDGMCVSKSGNIFATGPGGVWIFGAQEKLLGKIKVGQKVSNCTLDQKEQFLYLTADDYLLRIPLL